MSTMRVRYAKPGGREVDLPEASARRLIASGAVELVEGPVDEPAAEEAEPRPATKRTAAKKTTRRSR